MQKDNAGLVISRYYIDNNLIITCGIRKRGDIVSNTLIAVKWAGIW